MMNIQDLINEKFPTRESREKIKSIQIMGNSGQNIETEEKLCLYNVQLEGTFDLKEFPNLESFSLSGQNNSVQVIPQQRLTGNEKNILRQFPGIVFAAGNYLSSSNNLHLTRADGLLTEFNKNDLSLEANPNLNEGVVQELRSNTQRLANSFKRIIEVCKKLGGNQDLELAQRILQLEEENHNKEIKIQQLEKQIREKEELKGQINEAISLEISNQQSSSIMIEEEWGVISQEESQEAKIVENNNLLLRKN